MRGDAQWFKDVIAEVDLASKFESQMFAMGLSANYNPFDPRYSPALFAWFKFTSCARFADKPVWMRETFKDYGGYEAYIADLDTDECETSRAALRDEFRRGTV